MLSKVLGEWKVPIVFHRRPKTTCIGSRRATWPQKGMNPVECFHFAKFTPRKSAEAQSASRAQPFD